MSFFRPDRAPPLFPPMGGGYPTMATHPGGDPASFLAALTQYGRKTALLGKAGNDTFGKLLTELGVSLTMATLGPRGRI